MYLRAYIAFKRYQQVMKEKTYAELGKGSTGGASTEAVERGYSNQAEHDLEEKGESPMEPESWEYKEPGGFVGRAKGWER